MGRMNILPSELKLNDQVAVASWGSWGHISSHGIYKVVKVNKLKVVLERYSDKHQRTWSVKRNVEVCSYGDNDRTFIESVETLEERNRALRERQQKQDAWKAVAAAAESQDIAKLREAMKNFETVIGAPWIA